MSLPHPKCTGCPAAAVGVGFVPPAGPSDAPVLLLGQGPGREEVVCGRPFVGRAGQRLTRQCIAAGLSKPAARLANVVQCHLPGNRYPSAAEVAFCRSAHWGPEIATPRRVTVALGGPAQQAIGVAEGQWIRYGDGWAVGVIHPSAIVRGRWGADVAAITHLRRAAEVLAGAEPTITDFETPPPRTNLWPTLAELQEWRQGIGPRGFTVDIEAAGNVPLTYGLRYNDHPKHSVVLPWRGDDAELWVYCPECRGLGADCLHPRDDFDAVVELVAELMADPAIPKAMQNGQAYDVPEQLENVGFVVRGFVYDTLLMAHIRLPEMAKGLEPLSALYLGVSGWKGMADEVEGDGK